MLDPVSSRIQSEPISALAQPALGTDDLEDRVEERIGQLTAEVAQGKLIRKISAQIRSSLDLAEILDTAVRELQSILGCERVSIWKFQADGRTLAVVADAHARLSANLGQQASDPCLDSTAYTNGKIRAISDIYTADLSACHRDLLAGLEIRSKILVPILAIVDGDIPWGLISAIESDRPRTWHTGEIELMQQIATQIAIAIQQATAYERIQSLNAELESRVAQRTAQLQEREAQLQASQQFLQTVIETFPLAVFWKDRDSRFLGCNYNFAQDANLISPAQIVGKTDYDLPWGAIEGDAYRADDRETIDSGVAKLGIIETQTRADGTSVWVETNKIPLRNLNGDTIGILGTYQDITDRQQAELALQESQHFITQIAQASPNILYVYDLQAEQNVYVNREISTVLGYTPAEIQAMGSSLFQNLIHPDDLSTIPAEYALIAAAQDGDVLEFEYRMKRANGEWCWLLGRNSIFSRDPQGRVRQTIGTAQDITERKQAEQIIYKQAEQAILLKEITQRIRKSLNLPIVFETAVREIRVFLETDRVGIFKFQSDDDFDAGEFIAESVGNGFEPILGSKIEDSGFGEKLMRYYQQGRINAIEDIHAAGLLDDEVQVLAKFQVQANLVVPLFDGPNLWGLLCVHHCATQRSWQESEITFIRHIGEQIGIAIQQATLYQKVQSELEIRWRAEEAIALQLRQQQALGSIAQQIRNSLKIEEILAAATDRVKELMMVDRVTIFQICPVSGAAVTEQRRIWAVDEVVAPEYPSLMGRSWEDERIGQEEFEFYLKGNPHVIFDVTQDTWSPPFREYLEQIGVKSKIVAPILLPCGTNETSHQPNHPPQIQLWGLMSVHMCSTQRHWQAAEAQLLQQIADQLAIAIQQASLFEQLQAELTERQQAETQLRQSNQELARATRLKDEFLASMSHELRTPLNAILGMSEALQESAFGSINERQQKSISSIEKSGRHLLALINDILDLSKIEANKFDLELTDVSIQSLYQNSLLFIKELAHKRQIQLTTQLPEDLKHVNIRVDDRRCRQVLINLLSNAVKFTPEGGSVTLDVRVVEGWRGGGVEGLMGGGVDGLMGREGKIPIELDDLTSIGQNSSAQPLRRIVFSIVDTGIGIAPENIEKLFQSFVQIDSSLNRQYAGTGLGLALVKRIVELHGGTVAVESTVNRGSCFTVSLPFEPSAEIVISPALPPRIDPLPTADRSTPTLEKALVLVVEDNQANMETMTGYLKCRGYRPIEAGNGQQAIDLAQLHHPDIILMDIQMPGMDGFEASRQIRQIPECAAIPIVALTALAMPSDRQKCLDAGANQYVTKPVKLGQLIATIESLLHGDEPK